MEQQTNIVGGNIVFKTMLDDLANARNGSKPIQTEQVEKPLSEGDSISTPFKKPEVAARSEAMPKSINTKKAIQIIAILVVAAVFIVGGKFGYDWVVATFFTEVVVVEPTIVEQTALFNADKSVKVFLQAGDDLQSKLIEASDNLYQSGIVQFVVYKDNINPLNLNDLLATLGAQVPEAIKSSLGNDYMLYISVDGDNMASRYRLNLALSVDDVESLQRDLRSWEFSMQSDLASLHLRDAMVEPASAEFLDNTYESNLGEIIPIRYLNINDVYTTFDYALVKSRKYLILTTTKEAVFNSLGILSNEADLLKNTEDAVEVPNDEEIIPTEEIINENKEEVLAPEAEMQSRQVLDSFAQALISGDILNISKFIAESKQESVYNYLVSLEESKRIELGNKLQTEAETIYEKNNIALYVVDCSFLDVEKECNFYLENINGEWKIIQM